jgi:hypothetical protein
MLNRYLLGVVVEFGIGEADAGTIERDPGAPLHAHHQGAHGEDHPLQAEKFFFAVSSLPVVGGRKILIQPLKLRIMS